MKQLKPEKWGHAKVANEGTQRSKEADSPSCCMGTGNPVPEPQGEHDDGVPVMTYPRRRPLNSHPNPTGQDRKRKVSLIR